MPAVSPFSFAFRSSVAKSGLLEVPGERYKDLRLVLLLDVVKLVLLLLPAPAFMLFPKGVAVEVDKLFALAFPELVAVLELAPSSAS